MLPKFFVPSIFLLFTMTIAAQTVDKPRLDSYFDQLHTHNRFMGSVSVFRDGQEVYSRTVGHADLEKKLAADQQTRYRIGSISKTFTAVLVLKAAEEGLLRPDQKLADFFPQVVNAGSISLSDLLYHRSGIHNFTDDGNYLSFNTEPKSREELVQMIEKAGSDFKPGQKFAYSNSNYILLTMILEKLYGKTYDRILKEKIAAPLGLTTLQFSQGPVMDKNEALSYLFFDNWKKETVTDPSIPLGAGAIVSNAREVNVFADALFNGSLISESSLKSMLLLRDNWGQGIIPMPFDKRQGFGHTGGIDGFRSVFVYFPDDKVSVTLLSNGLNYKLNDILLDVLRATYGEGFEVPSFAAAETPGVKELQKLAGRYSSKDILLEVSVTVKDDKLYAQATGQDEFPLTYAGSNKFRFDTAGIEMEFEPGSRKMTLRQSGAVFEFNRK